MLNLDELVTKEEADDIYGRGSAMSGLYWVLKGFDVAGMLMLAWVATCDAPPAARVPIALAGWFLASVCASLEEQWKAKGWLTRPAQNSLEGK